MKKNTNFEKLNKSETILEHVKSLKSNVTLKSHKEVLIELLEQIEITDFYLLAYPQTKKLTKKIEHLEKKIKDSEGIENSEKQLTKEKKELKSLKSELCSLKLNSKHLTVLSIEKVKFYAEKNDWGLCKNQNFIYVYNGAYWAEIDSEIFYKFLGEASEKMGVNKFSARHYNFREQLYKQFLATSYLNSPESQKDSVLINLQNGTFEISNDEIKLRPFERSDFLTYQLPFEYNPDSKCPQFENYLDKVLPDTESQLVLAEYIGYIFIKNESYNLKEEKVLILYGTGANGKSVFFEVVNALLGTQNVSNYTLQNLTNDNGYYRAKIANKLINYASEINGKLQTDIFKQLVSGEPIDARLPYGNPFTLRNYAKLIFNCNELPKDVEHSNAYFRRFLIIPFEVTIPEEEQDKTLHIKIIESELAGVFNWVLKGLKRLLEQKKFTNCNAVQKAIEQYKIESNSVQMFIIDNEYKSSINSYEFIKDLYQEYRAFCMEDGITPFKKLNFIKQLKGLNFIVDKVAQNKLAVYIEKQ